MANDEKEHFLNQLLQNSALTPTDKWVAKWVKADCPPEASSSIPF
ncbi:hypothetical protein EMIT0111MI5_170042 [Burkholderia sp. IT-111MI5]